MDLPSADPTAAAEEIEDVIGIDATDAIPCSAKTGMGVDDILERVVRDVPPPKGDPQAPLQALIIDSWFDNYVGVVMLVRVVNGTVRPKDKITLMATNATHWSSRSVSLRRRARCANRFPQARWVSSSRASRN